MSLSPSSIAVFALLLGTTAARADLVAYWPLSDGEAGTPVSATGADDVIDDPSHGATDDVAQGPNDTSSPESAVRALFQ